MVQLLFSASDNHSRRFSWLCFILMQASWWRHVSPPIPSWTSIGFWGLDPKTIYRWFWDSNHQTHWRSVSTMPPVRSRHVSSSSVTARSPSPLAPLLYLVNRRLDLVNISSSTCTLARRCPQASATHGESSGPLDPLVQASCSSFTALAPSAWHVSTWSYILRPTAFVLNTCASQT